MVLFLMTILIRIPSMGFIPRGSMLLTFQATMRRGADPVLTVLICCRSEKKDAPVTDIDSPSSPESIEVSSKPVERQIEARPAEDGLGSIVRCLYFAQSHIINSTTTNAAMWAGTNAGSVLIYIIKIPDSGMRENEPISCQLGEFVGASY